MNSLFLDAKRSATLLKGMEGMGDGGWAGSANKRRADGLAA